MQHKHAAVFLLAAVRFQIGMLISVFPKIGYCFEKSDFFSIIEFGHCSPTNAIISRVGLMY